MRNFILVLLVVFISCEITQKEIFGDKEATSENKEKSESKKSEAKKDKIETLAKEIKFLSERTTSPLL